MTLNDDQDRRQLEQNLEGLQPDDGLFVESLRTPERLVLQLGNRLNGKLICARGMIPDPNSQPLICLGVWEHPTDTDHGECDRLEQAFAAVCRYLNTGGDLERFQQLLAHTGIGIHETHFSDNLLGCQLIYSRPLPSGIYRHVFSRPRSEWVVDWVEGVHLAVSEVGENDAPAPTARGFD